MDTVLATPSLRDLFDTPALRVLRAMTEGPLTMRAFIYISGTSPRVAKKLRERLEAAGLVVVETPTRRVSTEIAIRATPQGLRVAEESARLLQIVSSENLPEQRQ